ncbi:MAG: hypothetical protein N3A61_01535, partial [Ignavibacteria bacterium]|nr:hypothetical protein [Ignavibacteria bacterium]
YTPSGRCIQKLDYLLPIKDVSKVSSDTKKIFYTKNKRVVMGDGGVTPDSIVKINGRSEITKELLNKGLYFKYISEKISDNPKFDLRSFKRTEIIADFIIFLETSNFNYTPFYQKSFDELINQLETNPNQKILINEIKNLKTKFAFNLKQEILSNQDEVYSFLLGEFANQLKNSQMQLEVLKQYDDAVKTAINIVKNKAAYNHILGFK